MTEKRIYVLVPHQVRLLDGTCMKLPCGMLAAQAVHSARKMQDKYKLKYEDTTTIVLGARNQAEMRHVMDIMDARNIKYAMFEDDNLTLYGSPEKVLTAVTTQPLDIPRTVGVLDYLPLYACGCEVK